MSRTLEGNGSTRNYGLQLSCEHRFGKQQKSLCEPHRTSPEFQISMCVVGSSDPAESGQLGTTEEEKKEARKEGPRPGQGSPGKGNRRPASGAVRDNGGTWHWNWECRRPSCHHGCKETGLHFRTQEATNRLPFSETPSGPSSTTTATRHRVAPPFSKIGLFQWCLPHPALPETASCRQKPTHSYKSQNTSQASEVGGAEAWSKGHCHGPYCALAPKPISRYN